MRKFSRKTNKEELWRSQKQLASLDVTSDLEYKTFVTKCRVSVSNAHWASGVVLGQLKMTQFNQRILILQIRSSYKAIFQLNETTPANHFEWEIRESGLVFLIWKL